MGNANTDEAREFWNRFDSLRGARTVKSIAESIEVDYELIRVQRTRMRTPRITLAVKLAKEIGTTVEYLVNGGESEIGFHQVLYRAYLDADEQSRGIVNLALGLDKKIIPNQNPDQTAALIG